MNPYLNIAVMSLFSVWNIGMNAQTIKNADEFFKTGDFIKAEEIYSDILRKDSNNLKALIYKGYISLLSNRLEESERWFNRLKAIQPKLSLADYFLAETYYRRKQFTNAAPLYRAGGRKAMALKMESFTDNEPYKTDDDFTEIKVKFVLTDPLPVIEATINGEYKGHFIIDTGGGELILDGRFAQKVQAESFGIEKGSEFGGGKKAPVGHGKISSITLADQVIENIPIITIDLGKLELDGYPIDGVIGTVFLYQFLSTIDYKNGRLLLRNSSEYTYADILENSVSPEVIPFMMADDHFMMVRGTINDCDTMLLFVDTGLAGNAFTCPRSTLKKAGLTYQKNRKTKGLGGGGYFNYHPVEVEKICVQGICAANLNGVYGVFPPQIENSFGFTVNGLLSHEFFRNYSLTIDFKEMKYIFSE